MKISTGVLVALLAGSEAFQPAAITVRRSGTTTSTTVFGFDLSGNSWKPDSEKMGSTDTGDYFPEGYDPNEIAFTDGWQGSQELLLDKDRGGPELPGLENVGADAVIAGGINLSPDIPEGMEFIPSSVPDGEHAFNIPSTSVGEFTIEVPPVCMTFEDYFAGFSADSFPGFSVSPATGRMDRRGGEPTVLKVSVDPQGASGDLVGNLVVNLPEDNSKICYKITAKSM